MDKLDYFYAPFVTLMKSNFPIRIVHCHRYDFQEIRLNK